MVVVNAGYRFIVVDVGNYASNSDTGTLKYSNLVRNFNKNLALLPGNTLPGFPEAGLSPYCFVGDEAFPLSVNLMRPYPRRQKGTKLSEDQLIFNNCLNCAR